MTSIIITCNMKSIIVTMTSNCAYLLVLVDLCRPLHRVTARAAGKVIISSLTELCAAPIIVDEKPCKNMTKFSPGCTKKMFEFILKMVE